MSTWQNAAARQRRGRMRVPLSMTCRALRRGGDRECPRQSSVPGGCACAGCARLPPAPDDSVAAGPVCRCGRFVEAAGCPLAHASAGMAMGWRFVRIATPFGRCRITSSSCLRSRGADRPRGRGRPCPPRPPCPTSAGRTSSCCRPRRQSSAHRRSCGTCAPRRDG